jgi:FkbM family methyltransferase
MNVVGESGLVVAVEPEPKNVALLVKNVKNARAGINNVLIVEKGIRDRKKKAKLYLSNLGTGLHSLKGTGRFIEIDVDTLDNIVSELGLKKVDFIKIDVEGNEVEVLRGARKLLSLPNINLAIETHGSFDDVIFELRKIGAEIQRKTIRGTTYIYARTRSCNYTKG